MENLRENAILSVLSAYPNLTEKELTNLINLTDGIKGAKFVSLKDYNSDKSQMTEKANHVINVGVNYENQKNYDSTMLLHFDINDVNIDAFNYDTINLAGVSLADYKKAVKEALQTALSELQNKGTKEINEYHFNKVLKFNFNTNNILIKGTSVTKTVTEKGDFKPVKSAPKTVAKVLINNTIEAKTSKIRTFKIDNILKSITLQGETLELA